MKLNQLSILTSLLGTYLACRFDEEKTIVVWTSGEYLGCIPLKLSEGAYSPINNESNFTQFHLDRSKASPAKDYFYTLRGPVVSKASIDCGRLEICCIVITWDSEFGWLSKSCRVKDDMAERSPVGFKAWDLDMIDGKPAVVHTFYGPVTRAIVYNPIGQCTNSDFSGRHSNACQNDWKLINIFSEKQKYFFPDAIFKHFNLIQNKPKKELSLY